MLIQIIALNLVIFIKNLFECKILFLTRKIFVKLFSTSLARGRLLQVHPSQLRNIFPTLLFHRFLCNVGPHKCDILHNSYILTGD